MQCHVVVSVIPARRHQHRQPKMPRGGRRGDDSPREHRGRSQSRPSRHSRQQGSASSTSNLAIRGSIGLETAPSGSTGQPTDQGEASRPSYRNTQMIRDVNDKLNNIKRAIHEFSAETSLWVEELLHAQGSGIEGVEMVAGTLSNIAIASKRHLQVAIREDYDGFIQDLDNFTGPMRVQTEGPEDRKRQKHPPTVTTIRQHHSQDDHARTLDTTRCHRIQHRTDLRQRPLGQHHQLASYKHASRRSNAEASKNRSSRAALVWTSTTKTSDVSINGLWTNIRPSAGVGQTNVIILGPP